MISETLSEVPKKENVSCFLKDDYITSFHEYFGIFELIVPPSIKYNDIEKYYNNPNIIVLIIEPM